MIETTVKGQIAKGTLVFPAGATRLCVADLFRLIIEAGRGGALDVYVDADGELHLRVRGPFVLTSGMQDEFIAFCQSANVKPVGAGVPWSGVYSGTGKENDLYTVTVEEARAFAAGFGVEEPITQVASRLKEASPNDSVSGPSPIATSALAAAFDGLGKSEAQWREALGDVKNAQWVLPARVSAGVRPAPHTWNPVILARILRDKRKVSEASIARAFQTEAALRPWGHLWAEDAEVRREFGR